MSIASFLAGVAATIGVLWFVTDRACKQILDEDLCLRDLVK